MASTQTSAAQPNAPAPAPQQHDQPLEAEEHGSDSDSAYAESDMESLTASLSSSIEEYQYENGRRYHKFREGQYLLPNDEKEKDRLDLHHHMLTILQGGKLHQAPLENPQQILDLGTGTGIWAIEMGDIYTSAVVTGNDLSPIQPHWVPPNVKFEVDDIEDEWTHPSNQFDFTYARYLLGSIQDWPKLCRQAFKACKPGGYFEIMDPCSYLRSDDNSVPTDSKLAKWNEEFIQVCNIFGRSIVEAPMYKQHLKDAGFVEVTELKLKLPNAPWAKNKKLKEVGAYHMASFLEALEGLTMRFFTQGLNYTPEEVQVMLAYVRDDLKNRKIHTYYDMYIVYGRKPE